MTTSEKVPPKRPHHEFPAGITREDERASGRLKRQALAALVRPLGAYVDAQSRVTDRRRAVVKTVGKAELKLAVVDIKGGDGGELRDPKAGGQPSFHSAYSSCGLAVNTFGPWRQKPNGLTLGGQSHFTRVRFENKFPIFAASKHAPNLDVAIENDETIIAIESKLTEHLSYRHPAEFRDPYDEAVNELASASWKDQFRILKHNRYAYASLDAAQLVKHYLGLKKRAQRDNRKYRLLYLYWEPRDADQFPLFAHHRAAVAHFGSSLSDDRVAFSSQSYPELWKSWEGLSGYENHLSELKKRYDVALN